MMPVNRKDVRTHSIGIAGLGAIGGRLAKELLGENISGYQLTAVASRNTDKAMSVVGNDIPVVELAALADFADIVIECVPANVFDTVADPVIDAGKILIVMTASALLQRQSLIDRCCETGARILVPSGAMLGLDALNAVSEGRIHNVVISTRKPPKGLQGAPYLEQHNINVSNIDAPLRIFSGSVREAAKHFPANVNVAAALSLAGIGPDRTTLEVWADPALTRNTHCVAVESDSSNFSIQIQNIPSDENPATGRITPQSVIALLRGLNSTLKVGN